MKKIFQILIIPIILLSLCVDVCGETVYTEDAFKYVIRDNEVVITKYFGTEEEVTIPRLINNMPVTVIATGAFVDTYAKLVYLPDSIAYIEPGAFSSSTMYFGDYEAENPDEPDNPEHREDDHRIDNNDGSIEEIPSYEIAKAKEEGEVDSNGDVVINKNSNTTTNNKDTNQATIPTVETTHKEYALYLIAIVFVLIIVYFIIRKVRKNKND